MITTSAAFQTAINGSKRRVRALVQIDFGYNNFGNITASSHYNQTTMPVTCLNKGFFRENDYQLVGEYNSSIHKGWQGAVQANSLGVLSTPEVITINLGSEMECSNIWVVGSRSSYPVDFKIEGYKASTGWTVIKNVVGNTSWDWNFPYKDNILSQVRITITKISTPSGYAKLFYFGPIAQILFSNEDIQDLSILEEANSESANPAGIVTSNELAFFLSNDKGWFSLQNDNSPFKGLVVPKIKIKPYLGVEIAPDKYEMIQMGLFYLEDWDAQTDDLSASIIAYGALKSILNKPIPDMIPKRKVSVKTVINDLFTEIGIPTWKINVDTTLDSILELNWYPKEKVGDFLQSIAEAFLCSFYEDRKGEIVVVNNRLQSTSVTSLDDTNQIINLSNPQKFISTFPKVKLTYTIPVLGAQEEVINIQLDTPSTPGLWNIENITLDDPLAGIDYLVVSEGLNDDVRDVFANTYSITLQLFHNSNVSEKITVLGYGSYIETQKLVVEVSDPALIAYWPDKVLEIETDYIQNIDDATDFANTILQFAKDPKAFYSMVIRGNPSIEILDKVTLKASSHLGIRADIDLIVIMQEIKFDGGLEVRQKLRKVIT